MSNGYDIHSVGFGDRWNEIVVTEQRDVTDDRIIIKTVLLNPVVYGDFFGQLKLDIGSILDEGEARSREGRREPQEPQEEVTRYISGADYQKAVAKALEDLTEVPEEPVAHESTQLELW